jgi:hypothetical protein
MGRVSIASREKKGETYMFPLIMHIKQEDMERDIREDVPEPTVVIRDDETACRRRVSSLSSSSREEQSSHIRANTKTLAMANGNRLSLIAKMATVGSAVLLLSNKVSFLSLFERMGKDVLE